MPTWGVDLSQMNFDEYTYYNRPSDNLTDKWEEVPKQLKTLNKLGILKLNSIFLLSNGSI